MKFQKILIWNKRKESQNSTKDLEILKNNMIFQNVLQNYETKV